MADNTWQIVAANLDREKNTSSTFERSILGRVKHTAYLDPPPLSASNPIFVLPKMLTDKTVCDINDAVDANTSARVDVLKVVGTSFIPTSSVAPTTYLFRSSHTVYHAWDVRIQLVPS
jgi:hypothetical protein